MDSLIQLADVFLITFIASRIAIFILKNVPDYKVRLIAGHFFCYVIVTIFYTKIAFDEFSFDPEQAGRVIIPQLCWLAFDWVRHTRANA